MRCDVGMEFHIRREVYEGMKEEGYINEMEYCIHCRDSFASQLVEDVLQGKTLQGSLM